MTKLSGAKHIAIWCLAFILLIVSEGKATAAPSQTTNPHGAYLELTDQCANCHSTHSGKNQRLLTSSYERMVCEGCHDGTGSYYNAKAGTYWNGTDEMPSLAGGFVTYQGQEVTSTHPLEETGNPPGGTGADLYLTCSSCHDPHGYPSTDNYRLLRRQVNGISDIAVRAILTQLMDANGNPIFSGNYPNLPEEATQPDEQVYPPRKSAVASNTEKVAYLSGMDEFCSACHQDYVRYGSSNTAGNGETGATQGTWNYRHRVGVSMAGGATGDVRQIGGTNDPYWSVKNFPSPGLYTNLPMGGNATGAYIAEGLNNTGSLAAGAYHYVVTALNYGGGGGALAESNPGNVRTVEVTGGGVTLRWEPVANAVGYKIYRTDVGVEPDLEGFTNFRLLTATSLEDNITSFYDDGSRSLGTATPPLNYGAKLSCVTCHLPHGTAASVTNMGRPTTSGSKLLRLDNRKVCDNCHKKGQWP